VRSSSASLGSTGRLFASQHAGCAVQIRQLWSEKEPGLAKLVSPTRLRQFHTWVPSRGLVEEHAVFLSSGNHARIKVFLRAHRVYHTRLPRQTD
jgi:hypothetical protein